MFMVNDLHNKSKHMSTNEKKRISKKSTGK